MDDNRREQDLHMLTHPGTWPWYPFLTVKRHMRGRRPQCAVIWAKAPLKVVEGNVLDMPESEAAFRNLPGIDYADAEAIVNDGWTID